MKNDIGMLLTVLVLLCACFSFNVPIYKTRLRLALSMAKEVTVTNLDNKQIIQIPAGSPLSLAAVRSGMRLSFQCKAGHCSSCETILDGARVRTCQTKVPNKDKITISKVTTKR